MPVFHVRFSGGSTVVDLPSSINSSNFKLKSYRVLFNREDHGYHIAMLRCTLFNDGNVISYSKPNEPATRFSDIPLILDPEKKQTFVENADWNLGKVRNTSSVKFDIKFENCIERKRFDVAYFNSSDPAIMKLNGLSEFQSYFGTKIPMYLGADSNYPDQLSVTAGKTFAAAQRFAEDGTEIIPERPIPDGTKPFPNATLWVHTGVQVGNVDPQPGGGDYTNNAMSIDEANVVARSGNQLSGSGFRRNAIIYAYIVDLVFEIDG